jgi:ectoine hydroxylase-related dioxygenase (phytanoyl-CoA dioxygenase family)
MAPNELRERGFCVLRSQFASSLIESCRVAFWPTLTRYLQEHVEAPNRGPHRHFLPMPFERPCFAPEFFFDDQVLDVVRGALGERIVADQWACDVPLEGSIYQDFHADYKRPLFEEIPDLSLPPYMLVVSFGLTPIRVEDGPIEITPGTHRIRQIEERQIEPKLVTLEPGDVLIRHPWALHQGTPNRTANPRVLCTIRYVRQWYWDASRDVNAIPREVWQSLNSEQQAMMRFPGH